MVAFKFYIIKANSAEENQPRWKNKDTNKSGGFSY